MLADAGTDKTSVLRRIETGRAFTMKEREN